MADAALSTGAVAGQALAGAARAGLGTPSGVPLASDAYVFSFDPAGRIPMNPDAVTHRFGRVAKQLGLYARLHDLRHYATTQLIASGVDVRTVSGWIGHAGGGATTLKVYTHFQAAPDRRAAQLLEQTLRRPNSAS